MTNSSYIIDFNSPIKIHFIAIGGISMSALAKILLSRGFQISGSDQNRSALTDSLAAEGALVHIGHAAENVTDDVRLIVYNSAIHEDNLEIRRASELGIPMITRAELLGQIMKNYKTAIGVAGTHGKTTTTSMLSHILVDAGTDPTISVGGMLPAIGGNLRIGHSDTFLTEACEYTNSFLSFFPTVDVILNVEEDHLDFFKDLDDIRNSFKNYCNLLDEKGYLIINSDIPDCEYFYRESDCHVVTFGSNRKTSDFSASDIVLSENGTYSYTLLYMEKEIGRVSLRVPGEHNVLNSLAAIATACTLGIPPKTAINAVQEYTGVDRRFQVKGKVNGFTLVDDYAHHPSEIEATLRAALAYPHKKLWCIFQPHTYTRTKAFLPKFAESLSLADHVILAKIYEAREKDVYGVSSKDIQKLILTAGKPCEYFTDFGDIENYVLNNCGEGDLVITMGAGNIVDVAEDLLKK